MLFKPFAVEPIFQTDSLPQRPPDTDQRMLLRLTEGEEAGPQRPPLAPPPGDSSSHWLVVQESLRRLAASASAPTCVTVCVLLPRASLHRARLFLRSRGPPWQPRPPVKALRKLGVSCPASRALVPQRFSPTVRGCHARPLARPPSRAACNLTTETRPGLGAGSRQPQGVQGPQSCCPPSRPLPLLDHWA